MYLWTTLWVASVQVSAILSPFYSFPLFPLFLGYPIHLFLVSLLFIQHSRWQSRCTSSTLQGQAGWLLCHGMLLSLILECLFIIMTIILNDDSIFPLCRLWICWDLASGTFGIIAIISKSLKLCQIWIQLYTL